MEVNQKCADLMLILDETTQHILSSVVQEFLALGVKNVTRASLIKKPLPNYVGLYFISKESLSHVFEDFKKEPIYHSINILLNTTITPDIMQTVVENTKVVERLSYFGELFLNTQYYTNNIAIICKEDNLFKESLRGEFKMTPSIMADHIL
jgi:hypothetical protein